MAPGAVTMSAVARDSPGVTGEAADTPHCPPLQRAWLGEGQLGSLTRHKCSRGGVEPGPPLVLPLHPGCMEQQHTARPFSEPPAHLLATGGKANVRQEESTRSAFTSVELRGIPHWVQHHFPYIHPFFSVLTVYRDTQGESCEDENSP